VFDYLIYTLCYIYKGDASTQGHHVNFYKNKSYPTQLQSYVFPHNHN